jgi:hypothetical protein
LVLLLGSSHLLVHSIVVDAPLELEQSRLHESIVLILAFLMFEGLVTG